MQFTFSKAYHPELLEIQLERELLKDWLIEVRNNFSIYQGARNPKMQAMLQVGGQVVEEITKKVESADKADYQIDARDLKGMIRRAAGVEADETDCVETVEEIIQKIQAAKQRKAPQQEMQKLQNEAVMVVVAQAFLTSFSAYVAVQAHQEDAYLAMADEVKKQTMEKSVQAKFSGDFSDKSRDMMTEMLMVSVVSAELLQQKRKERNSPIAEIQERLFLGENGVGMGISDAVAFLHDLDTDKAPDKDKLRRITYDAKQKVARQLGITLSSTHGV